MVSKNEKEQATVVFQLVKRLKVVPKHKVELSERQSLKSFFDVCDQVRPYIGDTEGRSGLCSEVPVPVGRNGLK